MDSRSMPEGTPHSGVYCLRCYARSEGFPTSDAVCEACGFRSPPSLRRVYWTREPWLVRLEARLKILGIIACVGIGFAVMIGSTGHAGTGGGWVMAMPVALGVAYWQTCSKLTRHVHSFRAGIFWVLAFSFGALLLLAMAQWLLAYVAILMIVVSGGGARRFAEWKERRVARPLLA